VGASDPDPSNNAVALQNTIVCPGFGNACTNGVGACQKAGTITCAGNVPSCNAVPNPPTAETCDNVDNDCNGVIDNGNPGGGVVCASGLPGVCSVGTTACTAGAIKCNANIVPGTVAETCNGLDDNCNGTVDDGFNVGAACTKGVGECNKPGVIACSGGAAACNAIPGAPTAELCDGKDNNCDGAIDDGFNLGAACSSGVGACAATGIIACTGLNAAACNGVAGMPSAEVCTDLIDNDCDGTVNNGCTDTDGDGLPDLYETAIGTNPNDADSDDDGVLDGQEISPALDSDGDGLINALDPDSDNDGLYDGTEMGKDCSNPATDASKHHCIADADPATTTNPLNADTDGGGKKDGSEDANRNGKLDAGEGDPTLGHAADDAAIVDTDGDGLSDLFEVAIGSNPNDADTDDDGVLDGLEPNPADDTDGDGLINVLDVDSDNDGLYDGTEMGKDCSNPATNAALGHCTADADMGATTTSPLDPDTDHGGVKDGSEDANLDGKVESGETDPNAGHGADDVLNKDTDGDGLSDILEIAIGTNPMDADTDDDGVIDGKEPNPTDDTDGDGLINALDPDSDNDGLYDGTELGLDCSNPATDASKKHCIADADMGATVTDPLDADTDNGGVSDGSEDINLNGKIDGMETDPTAGHGADDTNPINLDSDGDGLSDGLEGLIGTNPMDADSDDDGVIDGKEPNPTDDTDGDGKINALDSDSDGDGLFDGTELGLDCENPATDKTKNQCTPDADKGATTTNPLDPDTDHGSVKDGVEDANHNGQVDAGETDPNIKSDDVATGCKTDTDCGDATSGKVCDDTTKKCTDGCRGKGGNGCPDGKTCSSSSATVGMCVDAMTTSSTGTSSSSTGSGGSGGAGGGASDGIIASGNGLICSATPGNGNDSGASWLVGGALAALVAARRRRRAA
jgi:hypothetical protein